MKNILLVIFIWFASTLSFAQSVSEILASSPTEAADKALASGNAQLFMVPGCFNGVPGYIGGPPKTPPKQLWKSCEELFGEEQYTIILKLEAWAKKYNQHIMSKSK